MLSVSMGVAWWSASINASTETATLDFLPGSSYTATGNAGSGAVSGSATYASAGLVHTSQLYEAVLGVGLLAALASFAAMALGFVGAFGGLRSRWVLNVTIALTVIAFGAGIALPIALVFGQPAAMTSDGGTGYGAAHGGCGSGSTPCNSFWGSVTANGETDSWGANLGWYLALIAGILLFASFVILALTRRLPYTREEVWAASGYPAPPSTPAVQPTTSPPTYSPTPPTASPPTIPVPSEGAPPVQVPPMTVSPSCPRCGRPTTFVAQYYRFFCTACQSYL